MLSEAMDESIRRQYLTDDPPTVVPLAIKPHFEALNEQEKKYAHYISRAAFSGTRINLRQVSPESEAIYDFLITLHKHSQGKMRSPLTARSVTDSGEQVIGRNSPPTPLYRMRISSTF